MRRVRGPAPAHTYYCIGINRSAIFETCNPIVIALTAPFSADDDGDEGGYGDDEDTQEADPGVVVAGKASFYHTQSSRSSFMISRKKN